MVIIEENTEFKTDFDKQKVAEDVVGEVLKKEGCPFEVEVDILITDSEEVREYNKEYRDIDKTTDVLSFPNIDWEAPADLKTLTKKSLRCQLIPRPNLPFSVRFVLTKTG